MLAWVVVSFSGGSSWLRNWTHVFCVSCIGRQILYLLSHWKSFIIKHNSCKCWDLPQPPSSLKNQMLILWKASVDENSYFFSHCWVGMALEGRLATAYSYHRRHCPLPSTPTTLLSGTGKIHATGILTQTALLTPSVCVCLCVCVSCSVISYILWPHGL